MFSLVLVADFIAVMFNRITDIHMDPSMVLFFVSVDNIGTETSVTQSFFMPGFAVEDHPKFDLFIRRRWS